MRLALCIRYQQKVFRLLWINESRSGIYIGVLGREADSHASYHQDGTRHFKLGSEHHVRHSDTPIALHKGPKQLGHFSLPLTSDWFNEKTAYAGDEKTETVVLLDERVLHDKDTLALDVWLLDRASESELLDAVARLIETVADFHVVTELVLSLENFPDHKLALTLRSARIRQVETVLGGVAPRPESSLLARRLAHPHEQADDTLTMQNRYHAGFDERLRTGQ